MRILLIKKTSKMKKFILLSVLFAILFTTHAQEQKVASKNKPSEDLENLQLADDLARYGYKTFSAEALIQAVKIRSSINTQELKYESFKQEPSGNDEDSKMSKEGYDLASILEAAKKYADGDPALLSAIADIEKTNQATRGRVGGPGESYNLIRGNSTDYFEISFIEGELAELAVRGDGDTDLDLFIYDSNGNLIKFDDDYTDRCYVCWVPRWTGRYTVKVVNLGPVSNYYRLWTN